MPQNPLHLQAHQINLPFANHPIWKQLPEAKRQACRELITELLIHVIHSELNEDLNHESQD